MAHFLQSLLHVCPYICCVFIAHARVITCKAHNPLHAHACIIDEHQTRLSQNAHILPVPAHRHTHTHKHSMPMHTSHTAQTHIESTHCVCAHTVVQPMCTHTSHSPSDAYAHVAQPIAHAYAHIAQTIAHAYAHVAHPISRMRTHTSHSPSHMRTPKLHTLSHMRAHTSRRTSHMRTPTLHSLVYTTFSFKHHMTLGFR